VEAEALNTGGAARIVLSSLSHSAVAECARRDKCSDAGTLSDKVVPPGDWVLLGQSSEKEVLPGYRYTEYSAVDMDCSLQPT
jgi:hypothetical protein